MKAFNKVVSLVRGMVANNNFKEISVVTNRSKQTIEVSKRSGNGVTVVVEEDFLSFRDKGTKSSFGKSSDPLTIMKLDLMIYNATRAV